MERVMREGAEKSDLSKILGADEEELEFEEHDAAFIARMDGRRLGQWESHAALVADLAAAREFVIDTNTGTDYRSTIRVESLAVCVSSSIPAPNVASDITAEQETVESCCRSIEVVAATCGGCDARILEVEQS